MPVFAMSIIFKDIQSKCDLRATDPVHIQAASALLVECRLIVDAILQHGKCSFE